MLLGDVDASLRTLHPLPTELVGTIFEYAVDSPSVFYALSLVSRHTRAVVTQYGLSNIIIDLEEPHKALRFSQLLRDQPSAGSRIRHLRFTDVKRGYSDIVYMNRQIQTYCDVFRSCTNVLRLSITTTCLQHTLNRLSVFHHHKIHTLHLECIDLESTLDVVSNSISKLLLGQISTLMLDYRSYMLLLQALRSPNVDCNFPNLTHFASENWSIYACGELGFEFLQDRIRFPILEKKVIVVPSAYPYASIYSQLTFVRKYEGVCLWFGQLFFPDQNWLDDDGSLWNDSLKLVRYGNDDEPISWDCPDPDVSFGG